MGTFSSINVVSLTKVESEFQMILLASRVRKSIQFNSVQFTVFCATFLVNKVVPSCQIVRSSVRRNCMPVHHRSHISATK